MPQCRNFLLMPGRRFSTGDSIEADSHAKVQLRKKVRGLRKIEQAVLQRPSALASTSRPEDTSGTTLTGTQEVVETPPAIPNTEAANTVVLAYCAAVRGILNDDQGGPLQPPGLRMAAALDEVRESIQRNLDEKKGGSQRSNSTDWPAASTEAWTPSARNKKRCASTSRTSRR